MRQIGTVNSASDAQRFLAYLLTQRVEAQAEQEGERWTLWVHDEDQVPVAKSALSEYLTNPQAAKYQGIERQAQNVLREEQQKRRQSQKNVVEMRGRWGSGARTRKAPLMISLAGLAVLTTLMTGSLNDPTISQENDSLAALKFADQRPSSNVESEERVASVPSPWTNIARGQIWRLVTPIFLHFNLPHLIFNLYIFWRFAGQIEDIRGPSKLATIVLVTAILSNISQALAVGPNFGGLSGVGYGLFGYLWMRVRQGNVEGYQLSQVDIVLFLVFFFLCIARQAPGMGDWLTFIPPNVANVAHAAGLAAGIGLGLMPDPVKAAGK